LTDEELIARLLEDTNICSAHVAAAADRIEELIAAKEALIAARDMMGNLWAKEKEALTVEREKSKALVEALATVAAEASVTVQTGKNGINFKKMYEGWRKIATTRIDDARAALAAYKSHSDEIAKQKEDGL
jgi:hypothetical protein